MSTTVTRPAPLRLNPSGCWGLIESFGDFHTLEKYVCAGMTSEDRDYFFEVLSAQANTEGGEAVWKALARTCELAAQGHLTPPLSDPLHTLRVREFRERTLGKGGDTVVQHIEQKQWYQALVAATEHSARSVRALLDLQTRRPHIFPRHSNINAFWQAAEMGNLSAFDLLFQAMLTAPSGITQDDLNSALIAAAESGSLEMIEHILSIILPDGSRVSLLGLERALEKATSHNQRKPVEYFLNLILPGGIRVSQAGLNNALYCAATHNLLELMTYLLNFTLPGGIAVSQAGLRVALNGAARNGHKEAVEYLLHFTSPSGFGVSQTGLDGGLYLAAIEGHRELVEYLLNFTSPSGLEVKQVELDEAFESAVFVGQDEVVRYFLSPSLPRNMHVSRRALNHAIEHLPDRALAAPLPALGNILQLLALTNVDGGASPAKRAKALGLLAWHKTKSAISNTVATVRAVEAFAACHPKATLCGLAYAAAIGYRWFFNRKEEELCPAV